MQFHDQLLLAGEHSCIFSGIAGQLEVEVTVPPNADMRYVAILGHPHSLQGGTMHNKVVTTLTRAFKELSIASVRFNFRGVGQSAGVYDTGIGESEDMLCLAHQWLGAYPNARVFFAGFSFGSYVAYRAASQHPHAALITIAPPIHHFDYQEFSVIPKPWILVQGETDEVVPTPLILDFLTNHPAITPVMFPDTGHFFHGQLIALKQQLIDMIRRLV